MVENVVYVGLRELLREPVVDGAGFPEMLVGVREKLLAGPSVNIRGWGGDGHQNGMSFASWRRCRRLVLEPGRFVPAFPARYAACRRFVWAS